jgi:ribosomal protein L24
METITIKRPSVGTTRQPTQLIRKLKDSIEREEQIADLLGRRPNIEGRPLLDRFIKGIDSAYKTQLNIKAMKDILTRAERPSAIVVRRPILIQKLSIIYRNGVIQPKINIRNVDDFQWEVKNGNQPWLKIKEMNLKPGRQFNLTRLRYTGQPPALSNVVNIDTVIRRQSSTAKREQYRFLPTSREFQQRCFGVAHRILRLTTPRHGIACDMSNRFSMRIFQDRVGRLPIHLDLNVQQILDLCVHRCPSNDAKKDSTYIKMVEFCEPTIHLNPAELQRRLKQINLGQLIKMQLVHTESESESDSESDEGWSSNSDFQSESEGEQPSDNYDTDNFAEESEDEQPAATKELDEEESEDDQPAATNESESEPEDEQPVATNELEESESEDEQPAATYESESEDEQPVATNELDEEESEDEQPVATNEPEDEQPSDNYDSLSRSELQGLANGGKLKPYNVTGKSTSAAIKTALRQRDAAGESSDTDGETTVSSDNFADESKDEQPASTKDESESEDEQPASTKDESESESEDEQPAATILKHGHMYGDDDNDYIRITAQGQVSLFRQHGQQVEREWSSIESFLKLQTADWIDSIFEVPCDDITNNDEVKNSIQKMEKIKEKFQLYDTNEDGFVEMDEIKAMFIDAIPLDKIDVVISTYDLNSDKRLNFQEFLNWCLDTNALDHWKKEDAEFAAVEKAKAIEDAMNAGSESDTSEEESIASEEESESDTSAVVSAASEKLSEDEDESDEELSVGDNVVIHTGKYKNSAGTLVSKTRKGFQVNIGQEKNVFFRFAALRKVQRDAAASEHEDESEEESTASEEESKSSEQSAASEKLYEDEDESDEELSVGDNVVIHTGKYKNSAGTLVSKTRKGFQVNIGQEKNVFFRFAALRKVSDISAAESESGSEEESESDTSAAVSVASEKSEDEDESEEESLSVGDNVVITRAGKYKNRDGTLVRETPQGFQVDIGQTKTIFVKFEDLQKVKRDAAKAGETKTKSGSRSFAEIQNSMYSDKSQAVPSGELSAMLLDFSGADSDAELNFAALSEMEFASDDEEASDGLSFATSSGDEKLYDNSSVGNASSSLDFATSESESDILK